MNYAVTRITLDGGRPKPDSTNLHFLKDEENGGYVVKAPTPLPITEETPPASAVNLTALANQREDNAPAKLPFLKRFFRRWW